MFSNCTGNHASASNISVNTGGSNYTYYSQQPGARGNFLASCMQGVCGVDPSNSIGRKYSTTMEDTSSIMAHTHHNLNLEDDCNIQLSRFSKLTGGREQLFIQAKVKLMDDEVDEVHDLLYLVKMPEGSPTGT